MWHIFLLRFILASTYTIGKASFSVVKPLFFVGTRMSMAGVILLAYCWFKQISYSIHKKDATRFILLTLYQVYLPFSIDFYAAQYVPSNRWAIIHAVCPFITALFSWIFLNEVLNLRKWTGLAIGSIGLATILIENQSSDFFSITHYALLPDVALTLSMAIYAYSWIMTKNLTHCYSPLFINGVIMTTGGLLSLATSLVCESWHVRPVYALGPYFVLLFLSILATITTFPVYAYLLRKYSATFLAFSSFLEPLFVAIFGWFFFAETISWYFVSTLSLLASGLYIFYKEEVQIKPLSLKEY